MDYMPGGSSNSDDQEAAAILGAAAVLGAEAILEARAEVGAVLDDAADEIDEAYREKCQKEGTVKKDGIVGQFKGSTHQLREQNLAQKLQRNINETKLDF